MPRGTAAVVRFSSLGDVLLAAHVPSLLRAADPGRRVVFVTKARHGEALRGHPDVDRFYLLADEGVGARGPAATVVRGALQDLAAALRVEGVTQVFDLHRNLRSARIVRSLRGAARVAPPKHALRRRLLVHARWLRPKPVPPLLASYRTAVGLPPDAPLRPWLKDALDEVERARTADWASRRTSGFVLLGVGARWRTKRWPPRHFAALGVSIERELRLQPCYALAHEDRALEEDLRALLPDRGRDTIARVPFRDLAAIAAGASAIVSNDSAVLHLGPALGVPALGIFGSTVPGFGFALQGPRDAVAEIPLPCRPCAVHGRERCPLGHHACMERLAPEIVLDALRHMLIRSAA